MNEAGRVLVRAPSNIAIVKYMGKRDFAANFPANPSLSMTLTELCTYLEIRESTEKMPSIFVAEKPEGSKGEVPVLSEGGREKFLRHFERCRARAPDVLREHGLASSDARLESSVEVRSTNTFPAETGIASSASSFAALTLGALCYFAADRKIFNSRFMAKPDLRRSLARLSREGSGSSCRSFEGPFVAWESSDARRVETSLAPLSDLIIVVSGEKKSVASTLAHKRVETSPHWVARPERAKTRFHELASALEVGLFSQVSEIADADFRDMHQLFETSEPSFSYFAEGTKEVLTFLEQCRGESSPPFAVTMDAGPNIHVLVFQVDEVFWRKKITERFPRFLILADTQGAGAEILE